VKNNYTNSVSHGEAVINEKNCPLKTRGPDLSEVDVVEFQAGGEVDHGQAMELANAEAEKRYGEYMLISWYDRDRDLESPPHATEGPVDGPKDGYIHYALSHEAALKVDVGEGRFVFFYTPVEW
jgi:hypothetical protein